MEWNFYFLLTKVGQNFVIKKKCINTMILCYFSYHHLLHYIEMILIISTPHHRLIVSLLCLSIWLIKGWSWQLINSHLISHLPEFVARKKMLAKFKPKMTLFLLFVFGLIVPFVTSEGKFDKFLQVILILNFFQFHLILIKIICPHMMHLKV